MAMSPSNYVAWGVQVENDDNRMLDELKNKSSIQNILRETFVVTNAHIVFQAVVFASAYAIGDYSRTRCHFSWIPFSLSIITGYIVIAVLITMTWRVKRSLDLIEKIKARAAPPPSPQAPSRSLESVTNDISSLRFRKVEIENAVSTAMSLRSHAVSRMVNALQENPDLEDQNFASAKEKNKSNRKSELTCLLVEESNLMEERRVMQNALRKEIIMRVLKFSWFSRKWVQVLILIKFMITIGVFNGIVAYCSHAWVSQNDQ
ncbi:hypothetical protein OROMI_020354 [Orobanche minor]